MVLRGCFPISIFSSATTPATAEAMFILRLETWLEDVGGRFERLPKIFLRNLRGNSPEKFHL